jgi:hypothetical protein
MTEPGRASNIQWGTLDLSAIPLQGRSGLLVVAKFKTQTREQRGSDEYRVSFEINRHHGLVSYDTEVLVPGADGPRWRYSGQRDLVVAVKDHFLATQLYSHMARRLGWIANPSVQVNHAPLEP